MATIRERINEVDRKYKAENLRHKKEMMQLSHETELIQLDCPHSNKSTRSIMGRETVTECDECDKEF